MAITVAITILLLSLLFLQWLWSRKSPAINWPFVGMAPTLLCNLSHIHDHATWLLKQSGGTFLGIGPWFFNFSFLITSDPMNLHHILSKNVANYPKGSDFKVAFEALGDGIFNSDSDMWKLQRKILHSIIGNKKFELYLEKITWEKMETGLIPILDHVSELAIEVDMQNLFSHLTFDTSCLLILGVDPCCLSVDFHEVPFEKAFDSIEKAAFYRNVFPQSLWKFQRWLNLGMEKERFQSLEIIDRSICEYISKRKQEMNSNKTGLEETRFDILTVFTSGEEYISAFDNPDKFLRDTAFNLLSAGRDTVGSGLSWFFWYVATNPIVEEKILDEMKRNLEINPGEKWSFQNAEKLSKLVYLHGAICEALRLYPPVPFNRKVAVEPDILPSGHQIAANMMVVLSFYSVARMEEVWGEDCLEFKPERWISERGGVVHVPSYKFTPFNAGPRACLGRDVSFILMKIVATSIIWNYKIHCVEGHSVVPLNSVVLHMKHGLKIRVTKRHV